MAAGPRTLRGRPGALLRRSTVTSLSLPHASGNRDVGTARAQEVTSQRAMGLGRFRLPWIALGVSGVGVSIGVLANKVRAGVRRRRTRHAARPYPGFFLVFEGGEGAGKSTQVAAVAAWFAARGLEVVSTREPGATELGRRLRAVLLDPDVTLSPRGEALLYAADRAEHVATVVRPALERGAAVISDRYVDSSLAYQGAGRALPREEVARLSRWATDGLVPDVTLLLDIDPAVGLARATGLPDRIEQESLAFHRAVRQGFLDLAAADPDRYLVVSAQLSPDAVHA